ncbi:MAG TPA: hypothetical protein VK633_10650, partial [Verrucomicrobiae bacterium]|nr:hypothetical protein [Verrucomicrobiae bacterium]
MLQSALEETAPPLPHSAQIIKHPQSRTVLVNHPAQLRVEATGFPLGYQWYFQDQPLLEQTNAVLVFQNTSPSHAGPYSVVVSNALGLVQSDTSILTVVDPLSVGVYDDPSFVDTSDNPFAESDNLQASLRELGHNVQPFTDLQSAITNQVLVFPVFKMGDPLPSLDSDARNLLRSYVEEGGLIIVLGHYLTYPFLNEIFGMALIPHGNTFVTAERTAQVEGTPFVDGPAALPAIEAQFSLSTPSLPALGARNLYGVETLSMAALLNYGRGNIVYLGWPWSHPALDNIEDRIWVETLGHAVLARIGLLPAPPTVTLQPQDRTALAGLDVSLEVRGVGIAPLGVQWFQNGQPVLEATNYLLTLRRVAIERSGNYYAVLSNPYGSATSQVATVVINPSRGAAGYYTDRASFTTGLEAPIQQAGFAPLHIEDISTYDLSGLDFLFINVANDLEPSAELRRRLPAIEAWVSNGGKLIVHDRSIFSITDQPNPFFFATAGTIGERFPGNNLEFFPPGTNLVAAGPYGKLLGSSLDNGDPSYLGYVRRETLPPRALPILTAGLNTNLIVAFSYGFGLGSIYYASLPLEALVEYPISLAQQVRDIYVPNLLEHIAHFAVSGPPLILAQPGDQATLLEGAVEFKVGVNGELPLLFQWFHDGTPIPGATNTTLSLPAVMPAHSGVYHLVANNKSGTVASAPAHLRVIIPIPWRINSLSTLASQVVDHETLSGDDRGGIAVSSSQVFYSGDSSTVRFSAGNLTGGASLGRIYAGLVSNLRTETVYTLANGPNPVSGDDARVTALMALHPITGTLTTNRIELNPPIALESDTGIFASYDAVILYTGQRVYRIDLASGNVLDLGTLPAFPHASCESWAYWGVAEFFDGAVHLVYVRDNQTIV